MIRVPCRVCCRPSALTRRGLVWAHLARPLPVRCPGAGRPPYGMPYTGPEPLPLPGQTLARSPLAREHDGPDGTCYLLHLDRPFGHAKHYLGWAGPGHLDRRLAHHADGSGANLLRHVAAAGIGWELSRTWPGDRHMERRLKHRGGRARLCPVCSPAVAARLAGPPSAPAYCERA